MAQKFKVIALTKDPKSIVVVADIPQWVMFIHSCQTFVGTHTNSTMMVGALSGHGAHAFPVAIDMDLHCPPNKSPFP
jgi:hypothetical protein